ncbi:MAG: hypothetical protein ACHRXM_13900 [Isosphaerales bacterium]
MTHLARLSRLGYFSLMSSQGPSRRDYITLLAVEPKDGTLTCEVQISFDRMQTVGRRSMGHAKECGLIVPMILEMITRRPDPGR